jgi:hypothetical protein
VHKVVVRITLAALLATAALGIGLPHWLEVRAGAVLLTVIIGAAYGWFSYRRRLRRSHHKPDLNPVPANRARILQRMAGEAPPAAQAHAEVFFAGVAAPSSINQRIVERWTPQQRTLHKKVTIEGRIPSALLRVLDNGANSDWVLVPIPIIVPRKGELHDNFRVFDGGGHALQTLEYSEYLQLVASLLRMVLLQAYEETSGRLPIPAAHVEQRALGEILKRGAVGGDVPPTLSPPGRLLAAMLSWGRARISRWKRSQPVTDHEARLAALHARGPATLLKELGQASGAEAKLLEEALLHWSAEELLAALPDVRQPDSVKAARELVRKLRTHYAIVCFIRCDSQGRFLVNYEMTVIPQVKQRPSLWRNPYGHVKARLRVLLGARPVVVDISLRTAGTARSYHAMIVASDDMYLNNQQLVDPSRILTDLEAEEAPTKAYTRFRSRNGQSYAHFYARFVPQTRDGMHSPRLRVEFHETPPGSLFRAAVAAGSGFLLIWLIALFLSQGGDLGTDAPAFLLVFPAVAAAWLGFETPRDRLFEGTLASRLSLVCTTIASIAASGLYMGQTALAKAAEKDAQAVAQGRSTAGVREHALWFPHLSDRLPHGWSVLGVTNAGWSVLVLLTLITAASTTYLYLLRAWEFEYLNSRRTQAHDVEVSD